MSGVLAEGIQTYQLRHCPTFTASRYLYLPKSVLAVSALARGVSVLLRVVLSEHVRGRGRGKDEAPNKARKKPRSARTVHRTPKGVFGERRTKLCAMQVSAGSLVMM